MARPRAWHEYVKGLCMAWDLSTQTIAVVIAEIEALILTGRITEEAIEGVLVSAGLVPFTAELAAPTIRAAIRT